MKSERDLKLGSVLGLRQSGIPESPRVHSPTITIIRTVNSRAGMPSDIPEITDYPTLTLGHIHSSCTDLHIVGLELKIYGLDEIRDSELPISVVVSWMWPRKEALRLTVVQIATHGRCNNKKQMAYFAHGLLGHLNEVSQGKRRRRDVIIVTLVSPSPLYSMCGNIESSVLGPTESRFENSR